jgi:hypothetical protein
MAMHVPAPQTGHGVIKSLQYSLDSKTVPSFACSNGQTWAGGISEVHFATYACQFHEVHERRRVRYLCYYRK